jgi:hypothetical protein
MIDCKKHKEYAVMQEADGVDYRIASFDNLSSVRRFSVNSAAVELRGAADNNGEES